MGRKSGLWLLLAANIIGSVALLWLSRPEGDSDLQFSSRFATVVDHTRRY